jgi:hypothetical protein
VEKEFEPLLSDKFASPLKREIGGRKKELLK